MALHQTITVLNALDSAYVNGKQVKQLFAEYPAVKVEIQKVEGEKGSTEFVKIMIPGSEGKLGGGSAPTFGIVGRLGVSGRARAELAWSLMLTVR